MFKSVKPHRVSELKIFETEIESRKKVAHNYDLRIREKSKSKGSDLQCCNTSVHLLKSLTCIPNVNIFFHLL